MTPDYYSEQSPATSKLLGDCYENSLQMAAYCSAIDRQISELYKALNRLLDAALLTGRDDTLSLWERELNLGYAKDASPDSLTEEQRRLLLRQYLCRSTPATEANVRRFLDEITDKTIYTNGTDGRTPTITLKVQAASLASELTRYLYRTFPAHMMPRIIEALSSHNKLSARTHQMMAYYTEAQLRNDS